MTGIREGGKAREADDDALLSWEEVGGHPLPERSNSSPVASGQSTSFKPQGKTPADFSPSLAQSSHRRAQGAADSQRTPSRVARVIVDSELPHLDRLFDYQVPPELQPLEPGMMVRVRFAGRLTNAWVVETVNHSDFKGKLASIQRVISPFPVVSKQMLVLATQLATRYAVSRVTFLKTMLPARHAGAEKKFITANKGSSITWEKSAEPKPEVDREATPAAHAPTWEAYRAASTVFANLEKGTQPQRIMCLTMPGMYPAWGERQSALTDIVSAAVSGGGSVIVVVPTSSEVEATYRQMLQLVERQVVSAAEIDTHLPEDKPAKRWDSFLKQRSAQTRVLIGTRSVVLAPLENLTTIVLADPGDDRMWEPQTPYWNALDVATRRSHIQEVSLTVLGPSMTVAQLGLVATAWAQPLVPDRIQMQRQTATVEIFDHMERQRYGNAGKGSLPAQVQSQIRKVVDQHGQVLIHVPHRGWSSLISCSQCRQAARCQACTGPLRATQHGELLCSWCAAKIEHWKCQECANTTWTTRRVGSTRTGEDLKRAFPETRVVISDAESGIKTAVEPDTQIVVATPGSEPITTGGFQLAVVTDPTAIVGRPELWAPEEALRRWMRVHSLVHPQGKLLIVGLEDTVLAQALVRRDPLGYGQRLLEERHELNFYPASTMIAVEGNKDSVEDFIAQIPLPRSAQLIGVLSLHGRDIPKHMYPNPTRALIRTPNPEVTDLMKELWQLQQTRSAKRQGTVTLRLNPPALI
ncbi:MAG: hypothetical protein Q4P06_01265 [Actinomycetaceae bacterium]|nr:hypothetical protein [Actinomycetaceae bacterium]